MAVMFPSRSLVCLVSSNDGDCIVALGGMDGLSVRGKGIAIEHLLLPERFVRHTPQY